MHAAIKTICGCVLAFAFCSSLVGQESPASKPDWPAVDRPWTLEDYRSAERIFASLPPELLPRLTDEGFKPVYARLTDVANLDFLSDASLPVGDRIGNSIELLGLINGINTRYVRLYMKDPSYLPETVPLLNFVVHNAHRQLLLVEEFKKTLDKNDPSYAGRMVGRAQMRYGASKILLGLLTCLNERDTYSDAQRLLLAKTLAHVFPGFLMSIDPDVAEAMTILLNHTITSEPNAEIKQILKSTPTQP